MNVSLEQRPVRGATLMVRFETARDQKKKRGWAAKHEKHPLAFYAIASADEVDEYEANGYVDIESLSKANLVKALRVYMIGTRIYLPHE